MDSTANWNSSSGQLVIIEILKTSLTVGTATNAVFDRGTTTALIMNGTDLILMYIVAYLFTTITTQADYTYYGTGYQWKEIMVLGPGSVRL